MHFADRLKELMIRDGVSSYRLAKEIGCTTTSVTNWLSGKEARQIYIQRIADFFCVSVDFLLGTEKEKAPTPKGERDFARDAHEEEMLLLARHIAPIPDEQRKKLIDALKSSADFYLEAMGIKTEEK